MKTNIKSIFWQLIKLLPNKLRYIISYSIERRRIPNLIKPRDYSEYICRDMLFNRNDEKAVLADKYSVREYVEKRGLSFILTEMYGVWDNANKIDFEKLPDKFALKCNHSCGMNIICEDKSQLNQSQTIEQLNEWLSTKHSIYFETHYNKIRPLIIGEEFITDGTGTLPMDYKIHCAHGKPIFIQVCYDRNENSAGKRIIFDEDWKNLHFVINKDDHFSNLEVPRPYHLNEMLQYASILSSGLSYARIDLYDTKERVIFGEITLTPMGGGLNYFTKEALKFMGDHIRN